MIRNERQFRVTKAERDRLARGLVRTAGGSQADDVPQWAQRATYEALASQVDELDAELVDYETLKSGLQPVSAEVSELSELPRALIRSRIAANMSQRELAERLGFQEQQIQRYEANDYAGASLARLQEVMNALGIRLDGEIALTTPKNGGASVRKALRGVGLSREILSRRFFGASQSGTSAGWMNAAARASRIFKVDVGDVLRGDIPAHANAGSFRASSASNPSTLNGYARYAEYLGELLARTCVVPASDIGGAAQLRESMASELESQPLTALLEVCWNHGVPVLPLSDSGAFYGACWRFKERAVISLKHPVRSPDRWAFLLAHEMKHARDPDGEGVLEQDLAVREWRHQPREEAADDYASKLLLGDAAEAMVHVAIEEVDGDLAELEAIIPAVAKAGGVSVGLLADHVAARLAQRDVNWWPIANRMHAKDMDAWQVARTMLFDYTDFSVLDSLDREILIDGIGL